MDVLAAISNGLKAVAAFFGYAQQRSSAQNTPAMQANATAKADAATADRAAGEVSTALKTNDLDELRKDAAE